MRHCEVGAWATVRYADPIVAKLLSPEIEAAYVGRGLAVSTHVEVFECPDALDVLRRLDVETTVHASQEEVIRATRRQPISVILVGEDVALSLLKALQRENITIAVIAYCPVRSPPDAAELRSQGAMDVVTSLDEQSLAPILQRGIDYRALLVLELGHRCESRRLLQRERELLGEPPEQLSDDLNTYHPPALPVGPLSIYNLDEASEAFERSYIDRVQQLCASAREAAMRLGVSSATLSRRVRRESLGDGT
ncbi:MAG: hypothetical protein H6729_00685 [Deltaproteobacteria bacterium]|nr:hypothetical protein [Deltaproteobacteria bacterium]